MIEIPGQNRKWTQKNNTDQLGQLWYDLNPLWASTGIDLTSNYGKVRLSGRILANTLTSDVATITGYPLRFHICGSNFYTIAGASDVGFAFYAVTTNPLTTAFAKDTDSSAPVHVDSTKSASLFYNDALYVIANKSDDTVLTRYKKIGDNAWSKADITNTEVVGYPVAMEGYASRVYFSSNQSKVLSWDSADTIAYSGVYTVTLSVANDFTRVITFIKAASDRLWIGTVNTSGGRGHIFEWDGQSTVVTKDYPIEASGALSCVIKDDVPHVIDSNGDLLKFNGGAFVKTTGFNRRTKKLLYNPISLVNNRFIHPEGMSLVNGRINLLIDGRNYDNGATNEETISSGVWEYDELSNSLYHKYLISPIKSGASITDYGQIKLAGVGALTAMPLPSTSATRNGTFFLGASYYQDATTTKSGIFYDDSNDTQQKAGSFVTSKIEAQDAQGMASVQNTWQNINLIFRKFLNSGDYMETKYRVSEVEPVEATITWASTTTFTTTTDISAYLPSGWTTGYEVEVMNGIGAGICTHITAISLNAGTYTVTVRDTITSASGTAKARFQFWKTIGIRNDQYDSKDQNGMGDISSWVQFKIWMKWTGRNEIERLIITNNNTVPAR